MQLVDVSRLHMIYLYVETSLTAVFDLLLKCSIFKKFDISKVKMKFTHRH